MKYCYANRRMTLYPNSVDPWALSPDDYTKEFLTRVKDMGFFSSGEHVEEVLHA